MSGDGNMPRMRTLESNGKPHGAKTRRDKDRHENQPHKLSWNGYRSGWVDPQGATVPDVSAATQHLGQMTIEVKDEQNQLQLSDCPSGPVAAGHLFGAPAWTGGPGNDQRYNYGLLLAFRSAGGDGNMHSSRQLIEPYRCSRMNTESTWAITRADS